MSYEIIGQQLNKTNTFITEIQDAIRALPKLDNYSENTSSSSIGEAISKYTYVISKVKDVKYVVKKALARIRQEEDLINMHKGATDKLTGAINASISHSAVKAASDMQGEVVKAMHDGMIDQLEYASNYLTQILIGIKANSTQLKYLYATSVSNESATRYTGIDQVDRESVALKLATEEFMKLDFNLDKYREK